MPLPTSLTTATKRRAAIVRQLSLQSPKQGSKSGEGRILRRQHSEDCKSLTDEVRVTGKRWAIDKPLDLGLRIGSEKTYSCGRGEEDGGRSLPARVAPRPRPSRVAWGERRSESTESAPGEGVEIVARRCEGQPRPSVRMPRTPSVPLASTSPLVLSRQQLAERLRRAWRTRDQQHNLDIFLAHGRSDREDPDTPKSGRKPVRAAHPLEQQNLSIFLSSNSAEDDDQIAETPKSAKISSRQKSPKPSEATLVERNKIEIDINSGLNRSEPDSKPPALADLLDFKMFPVAEATKKFGTDFSSRQFQMASMSIAKTLSFDAGDDKENTPEQTEERQSLNGMTASARRASFRSSQLFSKAVAECGSDEDEVVPICVSRPPLLRASSAPTPRPPSPVAKPSGRSKSPKEQKAPLRLLPSPGGSIKSIITDDDANKRSSKSEKRAKPCGSRRKAKDRKQQPSLNDESSDEEASESRTKAPRRRQIRNCGEVVTMVSLVSPAESDVEEPPTPLHPWAEDCEKPAGSNRVEPTRGEAPKNAPPPTLVFSLAPKKTVSFQSHPPISRSYSANFPLRRAPPGAPIIISTPQPSSATMAHRQDNRGVKRRLVRSNTAPSKEDEENNSSDDTSAKSDTSSTEPVCTEAAGSSSIADNVLKNDPSDEEGGEDEEPDLKTAKEKECWHLYKRMMDKGVCVSYDTVLRGMMTPTEYRLRKSQQMSRS